MRLRLGAWLMVVVAGCQIPPWDRDGDGLPAGVDCDDRDPREVPGTYVELLDGLDNDCDGVVDEAQSTAQSALALSPFDTAISWTGSLVGPAGDFDGDSYRDFIVAAVQYQNQAGAVRLHYGASSRLRGSAELASTTLVGDPAPEVDPEQPPTDPREVLGSLAGTAAAGAADLDGDGYDDLVIGEPGNGGYGRVTLISGGERLPEGELYLTDLIAAGRACSVVNVSSPGQVGSGVAVADANGDGYADVFIGASMLLPPGANAAPTEVSQAFVLPGRPGLLTPGEGCSWTTAHDELVVIDHYQPDEGQERPGAYDYGSVMAAAGDLDGDGFDDVLVGAPGTVQQPTDRQIGGVQVLWGSADVREIGARVTWIPGRDVGDRFGQALAAGPILEGGALAVVIGSPACSWIQGVIPTSDDCSAARGAAAFVVPASELDPSTNESESAPAIGGVIEIDCASEGCGLGMPYTVAVPGDVDGDGRDDLLLGAPGGVAPDDPGESRTGVVSLLLGPITSDLQEMNTDADALFRGTQEGDSLSIVGAVGDLDPGGGTTADLLIGAPDFYADVTAGLGNAYLFYGLTTSP